MSMSLIVDVFRDIVEKGAELHSAHKFLHFVSKIPFYTSITILVFRWIEFLVPRFLHTFFLLILGLVFLALAFGLSITVKNYIAYNYLFKALPKGMNNVGELLSRVEHIDLYTFREKLVDAVTDWLYEEMSKGLNIFGLVRLVAPLLFINIFLLPLALLYFIYALFPNISLANLPPAYFLYAVLMLLLASILSYINMEILVPSKRKSGNEGSEVDDNKKPDKVRKPFKQGMMTVIGLSLLGLGIPVSFSTSLGSKALIAFGLLLFSTPWDLLLYKPPKEVIQSIGPLESVAIVFMPSARMIIEPETSNDFGKSFVEACKAGFKLAGLIPEKTSSNSLSKCLIAEPSIGNIANNMANRNKNWSKLIKNTPRSIAYETLNSVRRDIEGMLRNYGYNVIEFVDISKLARIMDGKTLKELFTYYSIVESPTVVPDIGQAVQRLASLYKDKMFINKLDQLAKKFPLIIPEIYITVKEIPISISLRQGATYSASQLIYIAIPVIIALNPWAEPEEISKFRELLEGKVMSSAYRVRVCVKEVRGSCAMGYRPGDCFVIERFYISEVGKGICIHALSSMLTLLSPFLKGVSAKVLGIGEQDDVGYVQCPDPGKPYTCGGTVVFELRRERIE
jgi:uncharacterized repeat protein (TIGR04076 family)